MMFNWLGNCSIFVDQIQETHGVLPDKQIEEMKQEHFSTWLKYYVCHTYIHKNFELLMSCCFLI